jgi:RNA polymerase sigma factor (sigma-70 family)
MVWGVCRRLLRQHDAEDAFQATFLVLVHKAASIRSREMVGNWLYGVAHQTALMARRTAARRRAKEVQLTQMPDTGAERQAQWSDVQPVLDGELSRLPDIYRAVIVLCDLEGRTRTEAARQLGVPEGTVAGRLARARALLAKRLTQRGVVLSGGALAGVLSVGSASASASSALVASTIKVASLLAAGQAAGVSVKVAALTQEVVKAMFVTKIKSVLAGLLVAVAVCGATGLICRTQASEEPRPQQSPDEKKGEEKKGTQGMTDLERLQGKWRLLSRTKDGEETKYKLKDDAGMLRIKGSSMLHSEPSGKSHIRFRLDGAKNPKAIDMIVITAEDVFDMTDIAALDKLFDAAGRDQMQAIYRIEGDTLKLCLNDGKRPAEFEGKKGSDNTLEIYERVK